MRHGRGLTRQELERILRRYPATCQPTPGRPVRVRRPTDLGVSQRHEEAPVGRRAAAFADLLRLVLLGRQGSTAAVPSMSRLVGSGSSVRMSKVPAHSTGG